MAATRFLIWVLLQNICAKAARIEDGLMENVYDDDYDDDDNDHHSLTGSIMHEATAPQAVFVREGFKTCGGGTSNLRVFDNNTDNPGRHFAEKVQNCANACRNQATPSQGTPTTGTWAQFGTANSFSVATSAYPGRRGRCYCTKTSCTFVSANSIRNTQYRTYTIGEAPTPAATPAPTPHPCDDGSHGCDTGGGGNCVVDTSVAGGWTCDCAIGYECTHGCDQDHSGHTCTLTPPPPWALEDSDNCLQATGTWSNNYECADITSSCTSWAKDMQRCCPLSCHRDELLSEADCNALSGSGTCFYPLQALTDNDNCLQSSASWGASYHCKSSTSYCNSWDKDMRRCCPLTCNNHDLLSESACNLLSGSGTCVYPLPQAMAA